MFDKLKWTQTAKTNQPKFCQAALGTIKTTRITEPQQTMGFEVCTNELPRNRDETI